MREIVVGRAVRCVRNGKRIWLQKRAAWVPSQVAKTLMRAKAADVLSCAHRFVPSSDSSTILSISLKTTLGPNLICKGKKNLPGTYINHPTHPPPHTSSSTSLVANVTRRKETFLVITICIHVSRGSIVLQLLAGPISNWRNNWDLSLSILIWRDQWTVANLLWRLLLFRLAVFRSHRLKPARFLCPWDFPGKNTGVGCYFLLQGIFLTQRLNPRLLLGRQILYHQASWEACCTYLHC